MTTPVDLPDAADAMMPAWLRAWNRFWFKPIDPTGLGLIRVLCGLLLFYNTLVYSYDFFSYVGPNSWLDLATQKYVRKEYQITVPPGNWTDLPRVYEEKGAYLWSIFFHVHDPAWVVAIHVGILGVMLLFTVGLWTRVTSVLAWVGALQYVERLPTSMFGQDTMLIILALYLMIGNSGAALSVDRWLALRRERREQGRRADLTLQPSWSANLAVRLLQVHFCLIYLVSGSSKLLGAAWWNGTALWLCLANYNFAPMRVGLYNDALVFLCNHRALWEVCMSSGALFTLFTEIGFPFLVWQRPLRPLMVSCSILMHLGIGLVMGLSVFSLFMMVMVLAFVPPETMRAFVDDWADKLRGLRAMKPMQPPAAREALVLSRT